MKNIIEINRNLTDEERGKLEYEANMFRFADGGGDNPCEVFEDEPSTGLFATRDQREYNEMCYRYLESRYFENAIINGADYPEVLASMPYAEQMCITCAEENVDDEYGRWVGKKILAERDGIDTWWIYGIEEDGQRTSLESVPECRFYDACDALKLDILEITAITDGIEDCFARIKEDLEYSWKIDQMSKEEREQAPKRWYDEWARDPWNYIYGKEADQAV